MDELDKLKKELESAKSRLESKKQLETFKDTPEYQEMIKEEVLEPYITTCFIALLGNPDDFDSTIGKLKDYKLAFNILSKSTSTYIIEESIDMLREMVTEKMKRG